MHTNKLVKYFKNHADVDGLLRLDDIPSIKHLGAGEDIKCSSNEIHLFKVQDELYYGKQMHKSRVDAEVLISQLYPKLGIKSAIYVPAVKNGKLWALSNNIVNGKTLEAEDFFRKKLKEEDGEYVKNETFYSTGYIEDTISQEDFDYSKLLTKHCLKQFIEMHAIDLACKNRDRHLSNFFIRENEEGKGQEIITLDHEFSLDGIQRHLVANNFYEGWFYNYFSQCIHSDGVDIVNTLQNSKRVNDVVTSQELSQKLLSVDVLGVCDDIKNSLGYEIDDDYKKGLNISFEETAYNLLDE